MRLRLEDLRQPDLHDTEQSSPPKHEYEHCVIVEARKIAIDRREQPKSRVISICSVLVLPSATSLSSRDLENDGEERGRYAATQ